MIVLVDTPVWSFAYRRATRSVNEQRIVDKWSALVRQEQAALIGPVRQEILSGITSESQFARVRANLRGFDDLSLVTDDYELAAELCDRCRQLGVQGSATDFLICAVSLRYDAPVYTTDGDFNSFATHTGIRLHEMETT